MVTVPDGTTRQPDAAGKQAHDGTVLTWCHARLAIGSSTAPLTEREAEDLFLKNGITHVINLRRDAEYARSLQVLRGVAVLWNPAEDDGHTKDPSWFLRSIDFALGALALPRHRVAVVCCEGNNRSPSTALAILMAQGLPYQRALTLVREARPNAWVAYQEDAAVAVRFLGYQ